MKSTVTRKIVKELSLKYNLPESKIWEIVTHPFTVLVRTIREGAFKNVRILHLGIFRVKKNRFKYYKNEAIHNESESHDRGDTGSTEH